MPPAAYECVLFDLGGVLVRLGGVRAMQQLAGIPTEDELWQRWLTCRWVRDFERGLCSAADFADGVVADWGLPVGADAFLELFKAWPEALFEGAEELVRTVREKLRVGCVSNSNDLHWRLSEARSALVELAVLPAR